MRLCVSFATETLCSVNVKYKAQCDTHNLQHNPHIWSDFGFVFVYNNKQRATICCCLLSLASVSPDSHKSNLFASQESMLLMRLPYCRLSEHMVGMNNHDYWRENRWTSIVHKSYKWLRLAFLLVNKKKNSLRVFRWFEKRKHTLSVWVTEPNIVDYLETDIYTVINIAACTLAITAVHTLPYNKN